MIKKILLILLMFLFLVNLQAQQKTSKPNPKPTGTSKPEIDKLYEKYKDKTTITLFTPHGELNGEVEIELNPNGKPQSVRISGISGNKDAIVDFISDLINQKRKQGYKCTDDCEGFTDRFFIEPSMGNTNGVNFTFRKGKMYFLVKAGWVSGHYGEPDKYNYSIETGDNSRKGGDKATKFEF